LGLPRLVGQFDIELDRFPGEALANVRLDDCEEFVANHLRDMFADHLVRRKIEPPLEPLRMIPIEELVAEFTVAVNDSDRGIIGDKTQLPLALAQSSYGLSKLAHKRVDFGDPLVRAERM
jgi:hypothetical protein